MNQSDFNNAMVAIELANTAVSAADSNKARKHATAEAEKARDWQERMYDRQLDDQIAWRAHQEEYNSPEAQMKRYRDAGINPMYAITGNGQNAVITPSGAAVPMTSKADTPAPRNLRFNTAVLQQAALTKAQVKNVESSTRANLAQANKFNAEANEADARAEGHTYENVGKSYEADVINALKNVYTDLDGRYKKAVPFYQAEAWIRANKRQYDHLFAGLDFQNAKETFMHLSAVRQFEKDLHAHQRSLFEQELAQAKSATAVFEVSARWALANQWINSVSHVLGAAGSFIGAFKGTSAMPFNSRSFSESYGDHVSRSFIHNH